MKRLIPLLLLLAAQLAPAQGIVVDEYVPAPGQSVNVLPEATADDTPASMALKCTERINAGQLITLGAWGGYITFHFDHPVANKPDCFDFTVKGNSFNGSAEPGIVMVSIDDNGNGLPDDRWYELSGSADTDSIGLVTYNYEITYRYAPMQPTPWTDNAGATGTVDRNIYHKQEYYPLWLGPELTFSGTRLPDNAHDTSGKGSHWVFDALRYGYVDNLPPADADGNSFNIEWAVDANRQPVHLPYIDFIRVYTALNQQCGWVGETSTEVAGAEDLHPDEPIDSSLPALPTISQQGRTTEIFTIDGRRIDTLRRGINIVRHPDGSVSKIIK